MKKPTNEDFMNSNAFPSARKWQDEFMEGWDESEKELAFNAYLDGYKACKNELLESIIDTLIDTESFLCDMSCVGGIGVPTENIIEYQKLGERIRTHLQDVNCNDGTCFCGKEIGSTCIDCNPFEEL